MANEETKDSLFPKENSLSEIPLDHDLNSNVISREDTKDSITQPSPEFLNKLNRIGELPKQYDDVAVQVRLLFCKMEDSRRDATWIREQEREFQWVFLNSYPSVKRGVIQTCPDSKLKRTHIYVCLFTYNETQPYTFLYLGINDVRVTNEAC